MGQLQIEITQSELAPQVTVVRFDGDLDNASIRTISNSFELILEKNTSLVVADMADVTMLSSAALGEFMGGRKALVDHGGDLVMARLSLPIKTKLTLMGANKIFRFHSDIRSAINAYKWEFEGKSEQFTLAFPSELRFVPAVRQLASRLASQKGYSRRDAFRIETIVDEICNNAVEHGKPRPDQNISLNMAIDRRKVEISVINRSDPAKIVQLRKMLEKPHDINTSSADERRGRGLALVKLLSNDLSIDVSESGTRVHATKLKEE